MATVKLTARILDFSGNPGANKLLILESFRPPYFNSAGSPLQSETKNLFTPLDVVIEEDVILNGSSTNIQWFDDSAATLFDKTTELSLNDDNTTTVLDDSADFLYIGNKNKFSRAVLRIDTFAVAAGKVTAEYFNGTAFAALSNVIDETEFDENSLSRDGSIKFDIPDDWSVGAEAIQAGLLTDRFYIRLSLANPPTTAPDIDQSAPTTTSDGPISFVIVTDPTNNAAFSEGVDKDYTVDLDSGIIDRVASGTIVDGATVSLKYEKVSNGTISVDIDRNLVIRVRIPFSGYDVVADLTTVPTLTKELSLEDLINFPFEVT